MGLIQQDSTRSWRSPGCNAFPTLSPSCHQPPSHRGTTAYWTADRETSRPEKNERSNRNGTVPNSWVALFFSIASLLARLVQLGDPATARTWQFLRTFPSCWWSLETGWAGGDPMPPWRLFKVIGIAGLCLVGKTTTGLVFSLCQRIVLTLTVTERCSLSLSSKGVGLACSIWRTIAGRSSTGCPGPWLLSRGWCWD